MTPPLYSIVIPMYNKGPHIVRAVESVMAQSLTDFELIVVDDGSTDDGMAQLTRFQDPRIRLLHRDGPGPGASPARNLGIAHAVAGWVAFLDADDEWHPDFLQAIEETRTAFPCVVMVSTGWIKKEPGGARIPNAYYELRQHLGRHDYDLRDYLRFATRGAIPVWTSAVAVDRTTLSSVGGFPEGEHTLRGEDEDTWLRVMVEGKRGGWAPLLGATYHRDAENRAIRRTCPKLSQVPLLRTLHSCIDTAPDDETRHLLEAYRRAVRRRAIRDVADQKVVAGLTTLLGEERCDRILARHFNRKAERQDKAHARTPSA